MLSSREIHRLKSSSNFNQTGVTEELDVSKLYPEYPVVNPIEKNLAQRDFPFLFKLLKCKNADKALNRALLDEKCRNNYLDYLEWDIYREEGLNVLVRCQNQNLIIENFSNKVPLHKVPTVDDTLLDKYFTVFQQFITKVHNEKNRVDRNTSSHSETPLEYSLKNNNKNAADLILAILQETNPYIAPIKFPEHSNLEQILKETKSENPILQQKLQIAGIASILYDRDSKNIPILLKAGMQIYPTNNICRQSILHLILSTSYEFPGNQTFLVQQCLESIKGDSAKDFLKESFNGKNLLELAYEINPRNDAIIDLLKKAGATLPITLKPEEAKETTPLLIQAIEQNNLTYFVSRLSHTSPKDLIQITKHCIKNYDAEMRINPFLKALLGRKDYTGSISWNECADLALFLGKNLQLLTLLKEYGIQPSEKKLSAQEAKKDKLSDIDIFCEYVRTGNIDSIKSILKNHNYTSLLNERSSEGLTPTELAMIYKQYDVFSLLVGENKDYGAKTDAVFDIIDLNKIKHLLYKYTDIKYLHLRTVVELAIQNYGWIDKDKSATKKKRELFSTIFSLSKKDNHDTFALEQLILSITKGQLQTQTLEKLARKSFFKEKVLWYLNNVSMTDKNKLDAILSLGNSLQDFFAVQRGNFKPKLNRGTLGEFSHICIDHRSRNESMKKISQHHNEYETSGELVTDTLLVAPVVYSSFGSSLGSQISLQSPSAPSALDEKDEQPGALNFNDETEGLMHLYPTVYPSLELSSPKLLSNKDITVEEEKTLHHKKEPLNQNDYTSSSASILTSFVTSASCSSTNASSFSNVSTLSNLEKSTPEKLFPTISTSTVLKTDLPSTVLKGDLSTVPMLFTPVVPVTKKVKNERLDNNKRRVMVPM
jgi:hypothetical protein